MITIRNTQKAVAVCLPVVRRQVTLIRDLATGRHVDAGVRPFDVGIWLATDKEVAKLNRQYRGVNSVTDVLSFPAQTLKPGQLPLPRRGISDLGDVVLAMQYIKQQCQDDGLDLDRHLVRLFCHGICHLLGYDHEDDDDYAVMEEKESDVLAGFWQAWGDRPGVTAAAVLPGVTDAGLDGDLNNG
eukprot:jgi/Mesvir1/25418/Mv14218-RA.1